MTASNKHLQRNVSLILDTRGMTVSELAKLANISLSWVNEVLRGQGNPTLRTLDSMGRALGVPPHWLIIPDGGMPFPEHWVRVEAVLPAARAHQVELWWADAKAKGRAP